MPKLKRPSDADNRGATDFIESLDRGLRVLEVFGGSRQPMTLSDLAKAPTCRARPRGAFSSRSNAPASSPPMASCSA
jgi:hypothetical protein